MEQFEQRMLLAIGPELVAVIPNSGEILEQDEVLDIAPGEFLIRFSEGQAIDPTTLDGIQVVRSGGDGVLGDGADVTVEYGWSGIGDRANEVIIRFAGTLPDDIYQIDISGSGATPLTNMLGEPFGGGSNLSFPFELDLGAQVISVVPQPVTRDVTLGLQQAKDTITVYFNDDDLDVASASDPRFYQLFDANDTLQTNDDMILLPTSATYDAVTDTAVLTFASDLHNATYRLQLGASDESNETLDTAINVGSLFDTTGFSKVAFVGDEDGVDDVDLHRIEIGPGGATLNIDVTPDASLDPAIRLFDVAGAELTMINAVGPGVPETLIVALPNGTFYVGVSSSGNVAYTPADGLGNSGGTTTGSYRIDLGAGNAIVGSDDNSSFATATDLGTLGMAQQRFSRQIEPQTWLDLPQYPGGSDEPGHRDIPAESHGAGAGTSTSSPGNIGTVRYNFAGVYGVDSQGNTLYNQINEDQKDRTREIFEMYASLFGFEVYETPGSGIRVVTGDIRAVAPTYPPGSVGGISGGGMVIMNAMHYGDPAQDVFGGGWMGVALHEIGHSIGLGHCYDVRATMGASTGGEDFYPGQVDIIHSQRNHRPDAVDIDMYEFTVADAGVFTAETVAERLAAPNDSSLLNTALRLYRQETDGSRTPIAQNDDYFSNDSYIELALEPGTYYVGVSSTGNTDYDPTISDSGFGGLTDGAYDIKFGFAPAPNSNLLDATGTVFDGDNDGEPGGSHEFFFRSDNTIFVDKSAITNLKQSLMAITGSQVVQVVDVDAMNATIGTVIQVDGEQMEVTAINAVANSFTVTRGHNGTTIASHLANAPVRLAAEDGSLARPYGLISSALAASLPGDIIRIVGNGGEDDDILTADDNRPYLIGLDTIGRTLEDGSQFQIPRDVVVQIDAGAILKLHSAVIDVGTSDQLLNRSGGALQVLGTPDLHVLFTSYADDAIGGDSNAAGPAPLSGNWGGLVFRPDSDVQDLAAAPDDPGIFLNYVNQAEITYGGGSVDVDSIRSPYTAIHIDTNRPTVTNNLITLSANSAMSANPDAFDDSRGRIGPTIHGNTLVDNTVNGIFLRIATEFGESVDRLSTTARFDDTDIVHVITESLEIVGNPGGPIQQGGLIVARPSGRLKVDPGVVVKLSSSRIEGLRGNSHLIAEGTEENQVIFTSLHDDRFGSGGTFDTSNNGATPGPIKGDWGGLIFNANSRGSIDRALIAYGGGETPIAGGFANFSTIEVHHNARVRLANSTLTDNDDLMTGGNRDDRGSNDRSLIFVRQAQPIIVNNVFENNDGNVISINAIAMAHAFQRDTGRSTGALDAFDQFSDNHGPLVRLNRMDNNGTSGMNVRGETLTNESVWDDTDIVHVLRGEITVDQHHTYSGLRLQSAVDSSLIVKLSGANAGFTADGIPLDIDDRIGGTVQIVGQPGCPVILTSLADDSVGASFAPDGYPHTDTNNDGIDLTNNADSSDRTPDGLDDKTGLPFNGANAAPGDWRSLLFEKYSNDRNVRILLEPELANNDGIEVNNSPFLATFLGELAPNMKSGDENRVLGFEMHGHISGDDPGDVDVYSFKALTGTEVWIDIDRTRGALDSVVELIQSNGTILARSTRSDVSPADGNEVLTGTAAPLAKNGYDGGDYYTLNHHDAGFRVLLPGPAGQSGTYFVRVRSNSPDLNVTDGGLTSGEYQLQVRLQQRDEKPGSTVRFADIRYATVGIDVRGLPAHSPLLGESDETTADNQSTAGAQNLGNLLESDLNTISLSGELTNSSDIDFYRFNADYAYTELGASIQAIGGVNDGGKTWATVFDLDYSDGLTRGDTTMIVFAADGTPILIGRESNITDDQPALGQGTDLDDLTRGSVGKLDPFIGTVQLPIGTPSSSAGTEYYVAVGANGRLLTDLNQFYTAVAANTNIRLEPINSVDRIIEDHIGFQGYTSNGAQVDPINTNGLFDISGSTSLATHVRPFDLADVVLYVSQTDRLITVNPYFGEQVTIVDTDLDQTGSNTQAIQDIVFRSDGGFFAYRRLDSTQDSAGALVTVNPGTGALGGNSNDNILGTRFEANSGGTGATPNDTGRNFLASDNVDALTFDRTGFTGGVPTYDAYYSVRANDRTGNTTSVLYRATEAGSATESTTPDYGIRGNIQPSGVFFASATLVINAAGDASSKTVQIVAKAPGAAGDGITVNISKSDNPTRVTSVSGDQINLRLDDTPAATAQNFVDAINRDTNASRLVTARLVGTSATGESTADVGTGIQMTTAGGGGTPLNGYVTGLAFSEFAGTNLYGVTSAGEFIRINAGSGLVTSRVDLTLTFGITGFQGLALGPQNVQGGAYSNTLFAISNAGELVAFNTAGVPVNAFSTGSSVSTGIGSPTGLAFSPLDFNLWHPTTERGAADQPGHGINAPYDLSRTPSAEDRTHSDGNSTSTNSAYNQNEGQGGVSFYFGLEDYVDNNNNPYLNYEAARTQLGIGQNDFQRDLTSGSIGGNYDLPGGAYGSLITDPFDLRSSTGSQTATDRPTLYFNYFLETEGTNTATANGAMRDSARVFISSDGGNTWSLLATNNTPKGDNSELPTFLSHSRYADAADPRQEVQELYETSNWRQARVDLSDYVGRTGLVLRFDFSTAGTIVDADLSTNDPDLATPVDAYGNLDRNDNSYLRGQDNAHEGFYVDDIIIGWSERGEMITAANAGATAYFQVPTDPDPEASQLIEQGPYQVEIRRGFEHAANISQTDPEISVAVTLDPNDRLIPTGLDSPPKTDDFESAPWPAFDPALGWVPQGLGSTSPWFVLPDILSGSSDVARSAPFSYTGPGGPIDVPLGHSQNSTMQVTVVTGSGNFTFDYSAIVGPGDAFQVFVDEIGEHPANYEHLDQFDTGWHTGVSIPVTAGVHTFFFRYAKDGADPAGAPADEGVKIDNVFFPGIGGMVVGDRNLVRAQGAFHIENNFVRDVVAVAIRVDAGTREGTSGIEDDGPSSNNPTPGSPINFDTENSLRFAPGVVIQNNVVAGFGDTGIYLAGESNTAGSVPAAAVPIAKVINNTVYGGETPNGTAIHVTNGGAAIVLNNIVANAAMGISTQGASNQNVLGRNFFHGNSANGTTGYNAIIDSTANPLFVDPSTGNFYPADGAEAIDRSLSSLSDIPTFVSVKAPLEIPNSDAFSPTEDLFGQVRVDDPGQPPSGVGNEVFNDLGAIERADTSQPSATVLVPLDQGLADADPDLSEVLVLDERMSEFVIQLSDVGVGVDDFSVLGSRVHIWRDLDESAFVDLPTFLSSGTPAALVENADYLFRYDGARNRMTLLPAIGIWPTGSSYTIVLENTIQDLAGNPLLATGFPGTLSGLTVFEITLAAWDYGDAPDTPWNIYPSRLDNQGARHISNDPLYLGSGVTSERDSLHNADASGDSFDDGVRIDSPALLIDSAINGLTNITVTASDDGVLNAWIDFNGDGDWSDPGEQIFTDQNLVQGGNALTVFIPDATVVGLGTDLYKMTFGRFRFSSQPGLAATGDADDGEVEDYQLRLVKYAEDFGDAPAYDALGGDLYPTLVTQNGASHFLVASGPFLGSGVDAELDGQPDALAMGDDNNGSDDEGVAFPTVLIIGEENVTVDFDMTASSAGGWLNLWIDYNEDGDWKDLSEHVFDDIPVTGGVSNPLSLDVPATALSGLAFARVRVSSAAGLSFDGAAPDGEVEDYRIPITSPPVADASAGEPYVVNEGSDITLNGSKSVDTDGSIVLYEWDFDYDGMTFDVDASGVTATAVFNSTNDGVYNVGLRVTDNVGATDTTTTTVTVNNVAPTADANGALGPYVIDQGSDLLLDGSNSSDPGEDISSYDWDLDGDGFFNDATGTNPTPTVDWPTLAGFALAYPADPTSGLPNNTIGLRVTDLNGATNFATTTLTIYDNNPFAVFSAVPNPVAYDEIVTFDASASSHGHPSHAITGYEWDFNYDGTTFDVDATGVTTTHAYPLFGAYDVALRVTDDNGVPKTAISTVTVDVSLGNQAPVANAGGPYVIDVGDDLPLVGSGSDPDAGAGDSIVLYEWDLDGVGDFDDASGASPIVPWTPTLVGLNLPTDQALPARLRVTDSFGLTGVATTQLTVIRNYPPVAVPAGPYSVPEGTQLTLDGTGSTDDGVIALYEWDWDYNGGEFQANLTGQQPATTFFDDFGPRTIALRVTDSDGVPTIATTTLEVTNVAPVVVADADQTVDEGDTVSIAPAFTDAGSGDTHTATINWGDNTIAPITPASSPLAGTHVYADNGIYTVTVTVTDDDGGVGTDTLLVTVNNVLPVVAAGADRAVNEGDTVSIAPTFTDAGSGDTHTASINWGDSTIDPITPASSPLAGTHVYTDNGIYTVTVTVTDDDGGVGTDTLLVTVGNVAPVPNAGVDRTVNEGDVTSFTGSIFDAGSSDTHLIEWDFGDGGTATGSLTTTHAYVDNGVYTVTLTATDDDGGVNTDTLEVTVNNVAPAVGAGADGLSDEGAPVSFAGIFSDPGNSDSHTYVWDFGDGGSASGSLTTSHVFAADGTYVVTLTVTDDDGGVGNDTLLMTVNNVAPTADAGGPYVIDQGSAVLFNGSASSDPGMDIVLYEWDLDNDGAYDFSGGAAQAVIWSDMLRLGIANPVTGLPTNPIGLRVTDANGATDTATTTLTIYDNRPLAVLDATPNPAAYGQAVNFDGSGSSHGHPARAIDTYEWDFDYDGVNFNVDATGPTAANAYPLFGRYTAALRVTDDNVVPNTAMAVVIVDVSLGNQSPVANAGGPYEIDLRDNLLLNGNASRDPDVAAGDSIVLYEWDLDGVGDFDDASGVSPTVLWSPTLAGLNLTTDQPLPARLRVTDSFGMTHVASTELTIISNRLPTANPNGPYTVEEGSAVTFDGTSSTDDGVIALYEWDWDYNGGEFQANLTGPRPVTTFSNDIAPRTIALRVTDTHGATDLQTTTLEVVNVAPTVALSAPNTVPEGTPVHLTGSIFDPGTEDLLSYEWVVLKNGNPYPSGNTDTDAVSFTPDNAGTYQVTLTVTDDDGGVGTSNTAVISVENAAPVVTRLELTPGMVIGVGEELRIDGEFTDAGMFDTHTVDINWGDIITPATVEPVVPDDPNQPGKQWKFWATQRYTTATERLSVAATVVDNDGGGAAAGTFVHVADIMAPVTTGLDTSVRDFWYMIKTTDQALLAVEAAFEGPGDAAGLTLYNANGDPIATSSLIAGNQRIDYLAPAGQTLYVKLSGTSTDVDLRLRELDLVEHTGSTVTVHGTQNDDTYEFVSGTPHLLIVNGVQYEYAPETVETIVLDGGDGWNTLVVSGSNGDDAFAFDANGARVTTISNDRYQFSASSFENVTFDGTTGNDSVVFTGTAGDETGRFWPDHGTFENANVSGIENGIPDGFSVSVSNIFSITAFAADGIDLSNPASDAVARGIDDVYMYDSPGNDTFLSEPFHASMFGPTFDHRAFGFVYNYGYATTRDGGSDVAVMEGSDGNDKFKLDWAGEGKVFGKMYQPSYYYNRAKLFENISAQLGDGPGLDTVRLFGSSGDDQFTGQKDTSQMTGPGYSVTVAGYENLVAHAGTGNDVASFFDSELDDTIRARSHKTEMYGTDDTDATYTLTARKFDEIHATANTPDGGFDFAKLHDTSGDDHLELNPGRSTLSRKLPGGATDLLYEVLGFERVKAYGYGGGNDTVDLRDTPGDDLLRADFVEEGGVNHPWIGFWTGDGASRLVYDVIAFDTIAATSSAGRNVAEVAEGVDFLMLDGGWET